MIFLSLLCLFQAALIIIGFRVLSWVQEDMKKLKGDVALLQFNYDIIGGKYDNVKTKY